MSILISFLFTSMTKSAEFASKIEKARQELLEREHLQMRLQDFFMGVLDSSIYTQKLPGDKKESLIALFDHGIDPDPAFSGPVLGRVYLDENRNLSLAIWPVSKDKKKASSRGPWRNEILFSNVDDYEFHLLGKKTEQGLMAVNAELAWHDHWPAKRSENPSMARLIVRRKGETLSYAFFFSSPEPLVTYFEGGYKT
jgi:hypothetical protein